MQTLVLLCGVALAEKTKAEEHYDKWQEEQDEVNRKMKGFVWDERDNAGYEEILQFIFYLPLSFAWFSVLLISAAVASC